MFQQVRITKTAKLVLAVEVSAWQVTHVTCGGYVCILSVNYNVCGLNCRFVHCCPGRVGCCMLCCLLSLLLPISGPAFVHCVLQVDKVCDHNVMMTVFRDWVVWYS